MSSGRLYQILNFFQQCKLGSHLISVTRQDKVRIHIEEKHKVFIQVVQKTREYRAESAGSTEGSEDCSY